MARGGKWGCSYKRTTLIVCFINIVVALIALRYLYGSLNVYSDNEFSNAVKYTPDQKRKMEDWILIRRANEPVRLIKLVKELEKEFYGEEMVVDLPPNVKQQITDEILDRLRSLSPEANISQQREAVESWHREKLGEVKQSTIQTKLLNSTILQTEAVMLVRALESDWAVLSEDIGLWMPAEVINHEHDDKPEGVEESEEEILPGRPLPSECHTELHTDYGGAAVRWGLTHHKESAADCCQACLEQAKYAKSGEMKCNIWVYCPSEGGCYSPDIYEHKNQECWLKYAETPRLSFKDRYSEAYRDSHPNAPVIVPWVSGVIGA